MEETAKKHPFPVPQPEPLEEVLRHIRDDAGKEPQTYLKETLVPEGGE